MKKLPLWLLCILCITSFSIFAQNQKIALTRDTFNLPKSNFYISKVIDKRIDKSNIGFIEIGNFNFNVDLQNGLEKEIYNYIANSLPADSNKINIVLYVTHLYVSEKDDKKLEHAYAALDVEFCILNSDSNYVRIFQTKAYIEAKLDDVSQSHEQRIKQAIFQVLSDFCTVPLNQETLPQYKALQKSNINTKNTQIASSKNEIANYITLAYLNGMNSKGFALEFGNYCSNTNNRTTFPYSIGLERIHITQSNGNPGNISYIVLGVNALFEISPVMWMKTNFKIPVGKEYEMYTKPELFIGINLAQTFILIPEHRKGISIGFGLYEKVHKSQMYPWDFGLRFEIGGLF